MRAAVFMVSALAIGCTACTDAAQPRLSPAPYNVHEHNRFVHMSDPYSSDGWNRIAPKDGEQAVKAMQQYRAGAAQPAP